MIIFKKEKIGSLRVMTILGVTFTYRKNKINIPYTVTTEAYVDIYPPSTLDYVSIGKGTYIAKNATISHTQIGRFCSIGPNLMCGYGVHPTNGLSTSPSFYSTLMQNGLSFAQSNKIKERLPIVIGNDVFIGMNVSILDGVTIGDGAIIAAGSVVTKDVEPYAIVGGVPSKLIRYRFEKSIIEKLLKIKWWDWENEQLQDVEKLFFSVEEFTEKYFPEQ